jgi:hypothetical protein
MLSELLRSELRKDFLPKQKRARATEPCTKRHKLEARQGTAERDQSGCADLHHTLPLGASTARASTVAATDGRDNADKHGKSGAAAAAPDRGLPADDHSPTRLQGMFHKVFASTSMDAAAGAATKPASSSLVSKENASGEAPRAPRTGWPPPCKPAKLAQNACGPAQPADVAKRGSEESMTGDTAAQGAAAGEAAAVPIESLTLVLFPLAQPCMAAARAAGARVASNAGMHTPDMRICDGAASPARSFLSGTVKETTGSLTSGTLPSAPGAHATEIPATPVPFKGYDAAAAAPQLTSNLPDLALGTSRSSVLRGPAPEQNSRTAGACAWPARVPLQTAMLPPGAAADGQQASATALQCSPSPIPDTPESQAGITPARAFADNAGKLGELPDARREPHEKHAATVRDQPNAADASAAQAAQPVTSTIKGQAAADLAHSHAAGGSAPAQQCSAPRSGNAAPPLSVAPSPVPNEAVPVRRRRRAPLVLDPAFCNDDDCAAVAPPGSEPIPVAHAAPALQHAPATRPADPSADMAPGAGAANELRSPAKAASVAAHTTPSAAVTTAPLSGAQLSDAAVHAPPLSALAAPLTVAATTAPAVEAQLASTDRLQHGERTGAATPVFAQILQPSATNNGRQPWNGNRTDTSEPGTSSPLLGSNVHRKLEAYVPPAVADVLRSPCVLRGDMLHLASLWLSYASLWPQSRRPSMSAGLSP